MQVFRHLEEVPADWRATVLSVGNFDGVHRAHRLVLEQVVRRARELGAKSVAVTFQPHPMRILRPDIAPRLITPLPRKLALLEATGLDATLVLPFTRDLSLTPPSEFAKRVMARRLRAAEVHEGANFHFGHKAQGDVNRLAEFGRQCGFEVVIYPEMRIRGDLVSSRRIRELLGEGRVGRARQALGWQFSIVSTAGRGRGYGHKYTVPTINLSPYDELAPADGVYITYARINGECFESVTNIGTRPTFGVESYAVETHLLNFHDLELTAQTAVEIIFLYRLRGEIKFPSIEALRRQIAHDVQRARCYFRRVPQPREDASRR